MASTNKTTHLQLNQWISTDPVLRTDFNWDNQILDQAVGELSMCRLLSGSTTSAQQTVTLNVSQIDLNEYAELQIKLRIPGDGNGATLCMTAEGSDKHSFGTMLSSAPTALDVHLLLPSGRITGYGLFTGKSAMSMTGVVFPSVRRETLMSLEFFAESSGTRRNMPSGTQYTLYGIKE